ncbi:kinase-like domain-containing protein [Suillus fuscotomentosus]|uniref:Kinase-like domain-containing protein n=1 Tax=Suillus fuscotomentosus TaxID=1912939 RepID=A0AAD4EIW4_9AGAM|nr:kinase-like domain-containing protein [Suillus fuscotomentosus]KAG1906932.1 kinase-like domain-containing protein [Suillus fuscotomentosus]
MNKAVEAPVDLTGHILRLDDHPVAGGSFGNVYRGIYQTTSGQIQVAVKALRFLPSADDIRRIRREIKIWMKLKHRNIVPFIGVTARFGPPETISLVSPWIPNGTLTNFLDTYGGNLSLISKLWLLHDVAAGLDYLHSFPLIHGDLTGSNVLINAEGMACLVDFGLSTVIGGGLEGGSSIAPSSCRPGAIRWTAPELLGDPEISYLPTPKSDIYSFGSVMLQILSNRFPWYTDRGIMAEFRIIAKLLVGTTPPRPDDPCISEKHWALISECWRPISSTESRPTTVQLVDTISKDIANCSGETNDTCRVFRSEKSPLMAHEDSRPPSKPLPGPMRHRQQQPKLSRPTVDDSVDSIFAFYPPDPENKTVVPHAPRELLRQGYIKPSHRYPPINTLFVDNLPRSTGDFGDYLETRLRALFSLRPGYRRLLFTRKSDGRMMCFVDFQDVHHATMSLNDLTGSTLDGLIRNGGIRLTYSKTCMASRRPYSAGTGAYATPPSFEA